MAHAIDREPTPSDSATTLTPTVDMRVYRAGVIAGVLSFIAFLGVVKDLNALLDPGGRGEVAWGFLMVRYSSLQRVWFGYRFTDYAAWLATFPHLVVYGAAICGLIGLKRWGWYLLFGYVLYIPLSEWLYMLFYPLGYLTGMAYPDPIRRGEWLFLLISFPLELSAAWLLWRYRNLFVR
jgi:hypothetical protein